MSMSTMKFIQKPFLFTLLLSVVSFVKPVHASPEKFGANFSFATCVRHAGDGETLAKLFKKRGVNQLSPKLADHFLNGNAGKAWSITSPDGQFAVAYRNDGVCTVFIKKADAEGFISETNINLKRITKNVGWSFSPSKVPNFAGKNSLESFTLVASSKDDRKINIILSATYLTTGNYQVALSSNVL